MPMNRKYEIEARLQKVSEMYLQGKTGYEIAMALGFSPSQISRDLKKLGKRWQDAAIRDFDAARALELAKITNLERTYWEAWKKSIEDYKEKFQKRKGVKAGDIISTTNIEQGEKDFISHGNPRYLDGALQCVKQRAELLGLNAATKLNFDFNKFSDAQLEYIINALKTSLK